MGSFIGSSLQSMVSMSYVLLEAVPQGRILGFDQQMLIQLGMQILNTIIVAFVLSKLLYNPVRNFMKARADRIRIQMETAQEDAKHANELKAKYEELLKGIDKERNEILESARHIALQKEQAIIAEAKAEADIIRNRAKLDIERELDKAKADMKVTLIELSTNMASRFIEISIDQQTQNRLLDDVIKGLGETRWQS